jgi:hypothetical protein
MKEESAQIVKGGLVALPTAAGGAYLLYAQTIIGCFGILAGAILSIVLAVKAVREMRWNSKVNKATLEDIKHRQVNDLPCRRCTDKGELHES